MGKSVQRHKFIEFTFHSSFLTYAFSITLILRQDTPWVGSQCITILEMPISLLCMSEGKHASSNPRPCFVRGYSDNHHTILNHYTILLPDSSLVSTMGKSA